MNTLKLHFTGYRKLGPLLCLFFLSLSWNTIAQVSIIPQFRGGNLQHVDQLFQLFLVNNSPQNEQGILLVELTTVDGAAVVSTASFPTDLSAGVATPGRNLSWTNQLTYGQNPIASSFKTSGKLPFGEFVLCYYFKHATTGEALGENCLEFSVQINGDPALVYPRDGNIIPNKQPVLQWRGPISLSGQGVKYSLELVALQEDQSAVEALEINPKLLNLKNLDHTQLAYPLDAPPLKENVQYAWQISAWFGQAEIGKTDIWIFSLGEMRQRVEASQIDEYSYPMPAERIEGAHYIAEDRICFAFQNREGISDLDYKIYPVSNPDDAFGSLPVVRLELGWNKIILEGSNIPDLMAEKTYLLEITNSTGHKKYLKFKYLTKS